MNFDYVVPKMYWWSLKPLAKSVIVRFGISAQIEQLSSFSSPIYFDDIAADVMIYITSYKLTNQLDYHIKSV